MIDLRIFFVFITGWFDFYMAAIIFVPHSFEIRMNLLFFFIFILPVMYFLIFASTTLAYFCFVLLFNDVFKMLSEKCVNSFLMFFCHLLIK